MIADQEAQVEPHKAPNERVHEMVAVGAKEDHLQLSRCSQCGDIKEPWQEVENTFRGGEETFCGGGGEVEDAPPEGVSRLQIQTKEKIQPKTKQNETNIEENREQEKEFETQNFR